MVLHDSKEQFYTELNKMIEKGNYYNVYAATGNDIGKINNYSYLKHEFLQAEKRGKNIIIVYNSLYRWSEWLPSYMKAYEDQAQPFWVKDSAGNRIGNYAFIKKALGYD